MKFGFEILHYITLDETVCFVDTIRKYCVGYDYFIAIVDNASPNHSFAALQKMYGDADDVVVLHSDKNLGFAKGNNLGFNWLKENKKCDFIVMANNDIELMSSDFIPKVVDYYAKYQFSVLGPNIQNNAWSSGHVNPNRVKLPAMSELLASQRRLTINYILSYLGLYNFVVSVKKKTFGGTQHIIENLNYGCVHENVQLHGCFWVFSPLFVKSRQGLNPNTFMYLEEEILYFEMSNMNLKMISVPDILVWHKEGAATGAQGLTNRKKQLFILKNKLHSYKVLIAIAKKYYREKQK